MLERVPSGTALRSIKSRPVTLPQPPPEA
jgi:hypothetical protein